MPVKTLDDLFYETLRDVYYAEKKLVTNLPKIAKKTTSEALSQAILAHHEETKVHVERLEQIFGLLDKAARGKKCAAMEGLLEEGSEVMEDAEVDEVRDVGILAAAQAVEHYEIARYGALAAWAEVLGYEDIKNLLGETLEEEKAADETLSDLSETVNAEANTEQMAA